MARISEKNPKYRTKEEMCNDLSYILNEKKISFGTKMAVVDNIFWVWSEFYGKIKGCKNWSVEAKKAYESDKSIKLIHEHIVPRKVIRDKLFNLENVNSTEIMKVLNSYCIGVVVTKEEDNRLNSIGLRSKMPINWDGKDPWARYVAAAIEIEE